MNSALQPTPGTYAGLFLVALATLLLEILLTRIFSVTMWYHFAFVAVSIALFGMTVGALLVYLKPHRFPMLRTPDALAAAALGFGVSAVVSLLTHLSIPFVPARSVVFIYAIGLTYAVISIPFIFGGVCVCLALTRYPAHVSRLYAADLAGAAAGSLAVVYLLEVTDGPTAVVVAGFLASLGALCFASSARPGHLRSAALIVCIALGFFAAAHSVLVFRQAALLRPVHVKGRIESRPLHENWNSFSRIRVSGNPDIPEVPTGWGMSRSYPTERRIRQLYLDIDASAGTILTAFDGDPQALEHLKYDVVNIAHYIRARADVLVVGSGGGRDVLSALAFNQRSVLAVEVNRDIIDTVNRRFGAFTGHLDRRPGVTFVADEARSFVARETRRFDIIQLSLIDSWAATAAGAYVLAENSLYTVEAWTLFLDRLSPTGVLAVSRWYVEHRPDEMYRLTSLATAALRAIGVDDPRAQLVVVRMMPPAGRGRAPRVGVGTLLLARSPLSPRDLQILERVSAEMGFEIVFSPRVALDPVMPAITAAPDLKVFAARYPVNIAPPTDDSPFFFHMVRVKDFFRRAPWRDGGPNALAVIVLGALALTMLALTLVCIGLPLAVRGDRRLLRGRWTLLVFFVSIGLGYMLVEISQLQRLIIFLGHPTFSLSVVLVTLLSSSGLGSYLTRDVTLSTGRGPAERRLLLLLLTLLAFGLLTPLVTRVFQASATPLRIAVAAATLAPIGIFMGMAFPLGMKLASGHADALTPWLWGINGAASVSASVLAVMIALSAGITSAFWAGFGSYLVGVVAYLSAARGRGGPGRSGRTPPPLRTDPRPG